MAQHFDVSLKALFLREGDGIIRRLLFGGRVTEHLATEQPQIFNHRADMVVRTEDGALHQVEFQTSNEAGFALRMLEYYTYLVRTYNQHVGQTVLYLGRERMRLESSYRSPSMDFQFTVINLRELDAAPLLESRDWADNALALLARGDRETALETVMSRLRTMADEEYKWATGTLLLLSGILGIEEVVNERLKNMGMINVMENKVLGPMIRKEFEQAEQRGLEAGMERGMQAGMQAGTQSLLKELLTEKFGTVPAWALQRIAAGSVEELHNWAKRVLAGTSIEEILR